MAKSQLKIKYCRTAEETKEKENCDLCMRIKGNEYIAETNYFVIVPNIYPYDYNHTMLLPKRHIHSQLDFTEEEFIDYIKFHKKIVQLYYKKFGSCFQFARESTKYQSQWHFHQHYLPDDSSLYPNVNRIEYTKLDICIEDFLI